MHVTSCCWAGPSALHPVVRAVQHSESESDNTTEGVIWKARDPWSAPVERSSHGMQERKSYRLCSLRQGLAAGILWAAAAALSPGSELAGSHCAWSAKIRGGRLMPFTGTQGCHRFTTLLKLPHASAARMFGHPTDSQLGCDHLQSAALLLPYPAGCQTCLHSGKPHCCLTATD